MVASTNVVQTSAGSNGNVQPIAKARTQAGATKRSTQVVDHLPATDPRKLVLDARRADANTGETENPGQELPVSARPPVMTLGAHIVSRRKIVHHLDIRGEARSRESPLEQIMAQ